ncbi:MAG TPA: A24 family peptidase [Candidatus Limnocylindrales bacterium]|nr:A24 family peptidase [Candidatus Limnocylindrales bacterium]
MTTLALAAAAVAGALLGVLADRLSTRWPEHEPDYRRRRPDWRTLVVALVGAAVGAGLVARWTEPRDLAVLGVYCAALLVLLAADLDQRILPDALTLPLIAFAGVVLLADWSPLLAGKPLGLASGIGAAVGLPVLLFVSDRLLHGELGAGDLKLAVGIGLMSGVARLFVGLLAASIAFSVVLIGLIAVRRLGLKSAVPFGPVLILGAFAAALTG